jgi:hypothetical protein
MLRSTIQPKLLYLILCASFLGILPGCSEKNFAPDPNLKNENPAVANTPNNTSSNNNEVLLPTDFPQEIPIYQTAKLVNVETSNNGALTTVTWQSADPSNLIESFYQQQLSQNNWQIDRAFEAADNNEGTNTLTASKNSLKITVTVANSPTDNLNNSSTTQLSIDYTTATISPTPTATASPTTPVTDSNTSTPTAFGDLASLPEANRQYIQDLANLKVFTEQSATFAPNKPITRREYAKWLLTANNQIFANNPSKQVRLATNASQPVFSDIKSNDPDFGIIQGLAEAGIIPSSLSGDNNQLIFKPDAPLTREDLIAWKVPLDIRKSLPTASLDSLKDTWGFQDINKISPDAWRSLLADYQNGDRSNLRRTFGYTILFQPKKTVTKAEAAATLWYFGDKSDGLSAKDALQANKP